MSKVIELSEWESIRTNLLNKKIVFTNGCFDIIHAGHVQYLHEAKALGDLLIVGLNSDSSVKRLKGNQRPIVPQDQRSKVLSAFEDISYIIIFEEDTPYNLISNIKPDVLVKGGDWKLEDIVGYDIVKRYNGEVKSLSFKNGISTTDIIKKIQTLNG